MKISYKNTALGLIDDPDNFNFAFPDPDITPKLSKPELRKFGMSIIQGAPSLKELCGNNIQFVSKSFFETFAKNSDKLKSICTKEPIEDSGIIILGGHSDGYTHWHTWYYYINAGFDDNGEWELESLFMDFSKHKNADMCALDVFSSLSKEDAKELIWDGYVKDGRDAAYWNALLLRFIFFRKYCDLDVKVIPATKKDKHIGVKYINETNRNITVLDSTWFTTLVKTGAFSVSGHFRWQPYGPGNSLRKLIWISDFEKEGYTRAAKVLTQKPE